MFKTLAYGTRHSFSDLGPIEIDRAEPTSNQVQIDILFCGVCHSDAHQAKNEWKNTLYPCVPGHEIIGRVVNVGPEVGKFKIGDLVGVGCMIDSCHHCDACEEGLEQYCEAGFTATYNGNQRTPSEENHTYGGYSQTIVVKEDFVLSIPEGMDPASAAPILCAGVTTYSPMRHWNVGPDSKVGIVGLGGLGHMAVKIAIALGAEVTVITTSPEKANDAITLGAKYVVISTDEDSMKNHERSLDFILSTIPESHDVNPYMALLKRDGTLTIVGCIAPLSKPVDISKILIDRKSIGTSLIGGIAETQEVLDFCADHGIASTIKVIPIDELNDVFKQLQNKEADFRYVIDMTTLNGKKAQGETVVDKVLNAVT